MTWAIVRRKSEAQRDEVLEAARGKPGIEENLTKEQQAVKKKMLDEMKSKNAEASQGGWSVRHFPTCQKTAKKMIIKDGIINNGTRGDTENVI
jgi:hypothetical protein